MDAGCDKAKERTTVTTASLSTFIDRLESPPCAESLETSARCVRLLERLDYLVRLRLVGAGVELFELRGHRLKKHVHSDGGEAESDRLSEKRDETALMDGVVDDLRFELCNLCELYSTSMRHPDVQRCRRS